MYSIKDKCKVNTNYETDTFVGIQCNNGEFSIHFPLGYRLSEDDKELRKDIIGLLSTIANTVGKKESELDGEGINFVDTGFPFQAYLMVIRDFYERGYYKEQEVEYVFSKRGKIDWNRTIKRQRAVIQEDEAYYLDFVTKKNSVDENELITLIHEFCVYESFEKIGWLYTPYLPAKPRVKFNRMFFANIIREKLSRTFNDKNKQLFTNLLRIIEQQNDNDSKKEFRYGTYRFEYVWQELIDHVFGVGDKTKYFPKTTWHVNGSHYDNSALEPDTIMICKGDIYVLDAKYYKYGATNKLSDLPESTSVNKQITYGEYVYNNKMTDGNVYNAFIMPFDSCKFSGTVDCITVMGDATGNWRMNDKLFEHIYGVLIDVKHLMSINVKEDVSEIEKLSEYISKAAETSGCTDD